MGLNIRNKCQFDGIRITGLDRGRACQYRHKNLQYTLNQQLRKI
ncbi:hypothetical protein Mpal_2769 [Methanosphaerula palustris E1-9c]|uniref:Uncharacterized protein n=1 Tax=Methanosphaerula palustris (strain ATCC BAA-1556 / DSM 19958 / E1-9c) TaxID=521011 RepID=B8GFZ2_METPE|nr:hypothetical protein Mpal_2769 [Methanosphaerula palustris E1-9c]